MKAGADGKFLAWKQSDKKWYSFDEVGKAWIVLPGQEDVQEAAAEEAARKAAEEEAARKAAEEEAARKAAEEEAAPKQQVPTANKADDTYTVPDLSLEMIWVEPGTFTMGSKGWGEDTLHEVTLTNGFWLGKYEVTQAQWEKMTGGNPSGFKGAGRPVEKVSWYDAVDFCEKLTEQEIEAGRLPAGMAYQLPTNAEWEYACRAGTTTAYSWGTAINSSHANYAYDGYGTGLQQTTDVGQYAANPWGFYDMHGNVSEWCADWYATYSSGAVSDPVGPSSGSSRRTRGGSWLDDAMNLGSKYAWGSATHHARHFALGFRLSLRPTSK
jgi:formylglycine-generating enzyme required for sulfatase activity